MNIEGFCASFITRSAVSGARVGEVGRPLFDRMDVIRKYLL